MRTYGDTADKPRGHELVRNLPTKPQANALQPTETRHPNGEPGHRGIELPGGLRWLLIYDNANQPDDIRRAARFEQPQQHGVGLGLVGEVVDDPDTVRAAPADADVPAAVVAGVRYTPRRYIDRRLNYVIVITSISRCLIPLLRRNVT